MSVIENSRPASFKGVPFLVDKADTKEGVNRVNYLYINTGRRVSKSLGNFPSEFQLSGFIHDLDGDEYERKREALRAALSDPSSGVLVHPFLGNAQCVADKYKFSEQFKNSGVCNFSMRFFIADDSNDSPQTPPNRDATPSAIKALALQANRDLQLASANAFINTTVNNKNSSKSLFGSTGDGFIDNFADVGETIQKTSGYVGQVLDFQDQAAFYVDNPLQGFAAIADNILGIDGLTTDVFSKYLACKSLFNWGDKDSPYDVEDTSPSRINPNPVTNEEAERNTNSDITKTFMQAGTMIEAFAQSSNTDFTTVDEVNARISELDEQFEVIRDLQTEDPKALIFNFDITRPDYAQSNQSINDLRDETLKVLEQKKLNTPRIEIINIQPQPASVLAYTIYGDSSRAEEILSLNNIRDNMVISGDIKVLST